MGVVGVVENVAGDSSSGGGSHGRANNKKVSAARPL